MSRIISSLSEISAQYQVLLVDLWGCLHNGLAPFPDAVAALAAYRREGGGAVVLLTNSPRPRSGVEAQLDAMGVPHEAWDTIATSGDSARAAMWRGAVGRKVYHIGAEKDLPFFDPMQVIDTPVDIERVALEEAEGIVCTGPFDETADPETMRGPLMLAKQNGLKFLCANPDIVVDKGPRRIWCAGALARLYTELGGESLYFGKPHPPIYDLARRRLRALGHDCEPDRVLAIGDGIHTDILGAMGEGVDSLFITGGLAAEPTRTTHNPDPDALATYLTTHQAAPTYSIGFLR